MAKKAAAANALDLLKGNASKKESKSKSKIPIFSSLRDTAKRITRYLELGRQEKEIKAEKDLLGDELREEGRQRYIEAAISAKLGDIPSSVRITTDGDDAILFCVMDKYANVSDEKKAAIVDAGFGDYLETRITVNFDDASPELQEKVAALLVKHLSAEEQAQLISTRDAVKTGSLQAIVRQSGDIADVEKAITLLGPIQQLKQG